VTRVGGDSRRVKGDAIVIAVKQFTRGTPV
jgi:hypothetical protein